MITGISRIGHVGIRVTNIKRSLDFYKNILGFKLTAYWEDNKQCFVRIDDMHHEIVFFEVDERVNREDIDQTDTAMRPNTGLDHIAFEIKERQDWLNAIETMKSNNVKFVVPPCVHAYESGFFTDEEAQFYGGAGSHSFYIIDPDGNRLEFYWGSMRVTKKSLAAPNPEF
ncbi:VOC family protein [Gammaproteobacteria bacterium]|nr:VOC family protein [Gammaproteobacteria bacterium]